ncbi:hypothetical protein EPN28_01505 [Patescibacteria group bacterium]|nr:MAG: hypothetical protein EPN28_01505 [Patescibacteria group bacterium]
MKKFLLLCLVIFLVALFFPLAGLRAEEAKKDCAPDSTGQIVCKLQPPLLGKDKKPVTDPAALVGIIIKGVLGIVGALALLMVFWGAAGWLFAAGNPEKIKASTKTIVWALIGLLIIFASYMYMNGVLKFMFGG